MHFKEPLVPFGWYRPAVQFLHAVLAFVAPFVPYVPAAQGPSPKHCFAPVVLTNLPTGQAMQEVDSVLGWW